MKDTEEMLQPSTLIQIIGILNDLPQPDKEYILELLKHWQKIR